MSQKQSVDGSILSYEELLTNLGNACDGFSGAAIAGAARAAASRALERAVEECSDETQNTDIMSCLVTQKDFYDALSDVRSSMGNHDHTQDDEDTAETSEDESKDEENPAQ